MGVGGGGGGGCTLILFSRPGNGHMSTLAVGSELTGILLSIINFKFTYSIAPPPLFFFFFLKKKLSSPKNSVIPVLTTN